MFDNQRDLLLRNMQAAHAAYYRTKTFGGPSLYFHRQSLEAGRSGDVDRFAEQVYATLASWGMHRMGRGGSKMCEFPCFLSSLKSLWPKISRLQTKSPKQMLTADWHDLKCVFTGIRCMSSGTSLVGHSKVMAHAIPGLVPPVDRAYTLTLLLGHANIKNDIEREWSLLKQILEDFFYPIVLTDRFQTALLGWSQHAEDFPWDTSPLKVVDNLVIGLAKMGQPDAKKSIRKRAVAK